MHMRKLILPLFWFSLGCMSLSAQQLVLKKGQIMDSLPAGDSLDNPFSLYLPTGFSMEVQWPLLVVLDQNGKGRQALAMWVTAAEDQGYVLMSPKLSDSLSIADNMKGIGKALENTMGMLPIARDLTYVTGEGTNGRLAGLVPLFIPAVRGVVSIGAALANMEVLNAKRPFHYIGITSKDNFTYPQVLLDAILLNRLKFPNQTLLFDGSGKWPPTDYLEQALETFKLSAMAKKWVPYDSLYVERAYRDDLDKLNQLQGVGDLLWKQQYMGEMIEVHGPHRSMDSLARAKRELERDKGFKVMERAENAALDKGALISQQYQFAMEEDAYTHNFKNLGWWSHQMEVIGKYISGNDPYERSMGHRLLGYINALALDHIQLVQGEAAVDQDALAFLYMLKTILEPDNFEYYLKTVSLAAKHEDSGTALFYLEEALKRGFKDRERLYGLEDTALLRISPEFNELVSKYLDGARYLTQPYKIE